MLVRGLGIIGVIVRHQITITVVAGLITGLATSLIAVEVQDYRHSKEEERREEQRQLEEREEEQRQKRETKDYISGLEQSVFNVTLEDELIALARDARKTDKSFLVPTRDQIRLERFTVALESLELHLTVRTTFISNEDRFALLGSIIESRNAANLFLDHQKRGGTIADGVVTNVATDFFADLRQSVDWL